MPLQPRRYKILNIWVDAISKSEALALAEAILQQGTRPHAILASNPEKNYSVVRDPELFQAFATADLLLPDGIGMVWAARFLYGVKMARLTGVEFMEELCRLSAQRGYKIFLYGAKEEVNRRAVDILREKYPGINIVGRAHGYLGETEMPGLLDEINASGAETFSWPWGRRNKRNGSPPIALNCIPSRLSKASVALWMSSPARCRGLLPLGRTWGWSGSTASCTSPNAGSGKKCYPCFFSK